jgi:hypothetical protein
MNGAGSVGDKLGAAWRRERLYFALRASIILLAGAGALAVIALAADRLLDLPGAARMALLLADLGLVGWLAARHGRGAFARYRPARTALQVERLHPDLHSVLVSCVQFAARAPDPGVSRELCARVCDRAAERAAEMDFGAIVRFRRLKRLLAAAAAVAAFWTVLGAVQTRVVYVFACRMLNPRSAMAYPTRTTIELVTGDITVQEGAAFHVEARVGGVIPATGRIYVALDAAGWERLELTRGEGDRFRYVCEETARDFTYYFRLGDARSPVHRVSVVPAPRIGRACVRLAPPAYTGIAECDVENLTLQVPEGTRVTWTVWLDRAVSGALLTVEGAEALPMECGPDGKTVRASVLAEASRPYRFRWTEREHGYTYEGPRNFIQVAPDKPPRIELLRPAADEKGTTKKRLMLRYRAADDYGLSAVALLVMLNEGREKRIELGGCDGQRAVEGAANLALAEIIPEVGEGDIVTYAIEIRDGYPGGNGSHTARSESRRVQILKEADYLAYLHRERTACLRALRPVYREERAAHETVTALRAMEEVR